MLGEAARCRECGQYISFIRTKKGKLMPVDGFSLQIVPADKGERFINEAGEMIRGTPVNVAGPRTVRVWRPHFGSCAAREKEKNRAAAEGWNQTQERLARERQEMKDAEAAAAAARRAEKERKEAAARAFEDQQLSFFGA